MCLFLFLSLKYSHCILTYFKENDSNTNCLIVCLLWVLFKTFPAVSIIKHNVEHLLRVWLSDSDIKLLLYGRALRSEVKLDPLELLGKKYKVTTRNMIESWTTVTETHWWQSADVSQVNNMFDEVHPARDFHNVVKQSIDDMMGREVTFDILFHNSEHQATLFRYGIKKSEQVSRQTMLFHWYQLVFLLISVYSVVLNQISSLTLPSKTWATANQSRAF